MKHIIKAVILFGLCTLALWGCKSKQPQKIDLSGIHTTGAPTTADPAGDAESAVKETTSPADSTKASGSDKPSVSASLGTYQSGGISIEYPVVSHMDDSELQKAVNEQLKTNAQSITAGYEADESQDTLKVKCKVISVDRRRIVVTYSGTYSAKGAAHPVNLFYTNTIDLGNGADIGLADYGDAETLAAYVCSADCQFFDISSDVEAEARKYFTAQKPEDLVEIFQNADFPLNGAAFPESFSYEKQGVIYVSVPVAHALGDYVMIKFTPETK